MRADYRRQLFFSVLLPDNDYIPNASHSTNLKTAWLVAYSSKMSIYFDN